MSIHQFEESLARARPAEKRLDQYLVDLGYSDITSVSMDDERRGIDRIAVKAGDRITFEYKADFRAAKTGNAYIETVSNNVSNKPGWLFTCQADWILYYIVAPEPYVMWLKPKVLQQALDGWRELYKTSSAINPGYASYGVLVPLDVVKQIADRVEFLGQSPRKQSFL